MEKMVKTDKSDFIYYKDFIQKFKRICFNSVFKKLNHFKISGYKLDKPIIKINRRFIEFYYKFKNFTKIFVLHFKLIDIYSQRIIKLQKILAQTMTDNLIVLILS